MATPFPADFAQVFGRAWSSEPDRLAQLFAEDATYLDVAMGAQVTGRAAIADYQRHMTAFAADSQVEFHSCVHASGYLTLEWTWTGTASGPIRLPDGRLIEASGETFSVPGVAVCTHDEQGQLTSHKDYWDLCTVLTQADKLSV